MPKHTELFAWPPCPGPVNLGTVGRQATLLLLLGGVVGLLYVLVLLQIFRTSRRGCLLATDSFGQGPCCPTPACALCYTAVRLVGIGRAARGRVRMHALQLAAFDRQSAHAAAYRPLV